MAGWSRSWLEGLVRTPGRGLVRSEQWPEEADGGVAQRSPVGDVHGPWNRQDKGWENRSSWDGGRGAGSVQLASVI